MNLCVGLLMLLTLGVFGRQTIPDDSACQHLLRQRGTGSLMVGPWELGVCACKSKGDELITIREDGDLEDLLRRGRHAIPEIFEREGGTTIVWLGATDGEQEGVWKTAKDGSILPEAMEPEGNTDKFNCAAIKDGEAHKAWGCWDETGVILCDDDI